MPLEDHLEGNPHAHDRYLELLLEGPTALLQALRNERELLLAIAEADTAPNLRQWFSEREIVRAKGGWAHDPERTGPVGDVAAGVEWTWTGVHDEGTKDRSFNNIAPSGQSVTVHGFTLFGVEKDDRLADQLMVRRYIDWAGVFAQLGLTLNWRTPV
jgi:hypothetical protein